MSRDNAAEADAAEGRPGRPYAVRVIRLAGNSGVTAVGGAAAGMPGCAVAGAVLAASPAPAR
jgi:hypothetical protein